MRLTQGPGLVGMGNPSYDCLVSFITQWLRTSAHNRNSLFSFPSNTSEPPCTGLPTTLQRIEPCSYHRLHAPGLTHHPPPPRKQPVISNPSRVWSRGSLPCAPMELEALAKEKGPILRPQPLKRTHHPVGVLALS